MGYTTTFLGEFSCYHPENHNLGAFLKAIHEGDRAAVAALGDWLIDRDDPRGEAVARLAIQVNEGLAPLWPLFGLRPEQAAYLRQFSRTRRMKRDAAKASLLPHPVRDAAGLPIGLEAGYFVGGTGDYGQDRDASTLDTNRPPEGQPELWCQWTANKDATAIVWNRGEKFYDYVEWLKYLVAQFLNPWGYLVNGMVTWQGEEERDRGWINVVETAVRATPPARR